ncbi:MAG: hypothetical protein HQL50_03490 [Magnetococcales bacterium]|nr:hypothetical protein [Magnetococcales bacterium]
MAINAVKGTLPTVIGINPNVRYQQDDLTSFGAKRSTYHPIELGLVRGLTGSGIDLPEEGEYTRLYMRGRAGSAQLLLTSGSNSSLFSRLIGGEKSALFSTEESNSTSLFDGLSSTDSTASSTRITSRLSYGYDRQGGQSDLSSSSTTTSSTSGSFLSTTA